MKTSIASQVGFTFIEVTIAGFLMMALIPLGWLFWNAANENYNHSLAQFQLTEQASQTAYLLASQLRSAEIAMDGAYPLAILNDNEIAFYCDTDADGNVERVRYFQDGTNLMKGLIRPSGNPPGYVVTEEKLSIVVSQLASVHSPLFTYYNGNWPGDTTNNPLTLSNRSLNTRMIGISIPITIKDGATTSTSTASATVQVRNLKDNL